jgi:6-phosphofructokinase 1
VGERAIGDREHKRLSVDALVDRIVDLMLTREKRGKHYGTIVLAEGLAELLPDEVIAMLPRDEHGHIPLGGIDLGKLVAERVSARYAERTGGKKKVASVQLGYESRCAPPHAFDVMLGSQLGIGAYRALVEEHKDGYMVSTSGQLDLHYVPFSELVNENTLRTEVRFIAQGSDFHRLARFLETRVDRLRDWAPGRRPEQ